MRLSTKNLVILGVVFSSGLLITLGKIHINKQNISNSSEKFNKMVTYNDYTYAYDLLFGSDFYSTLYKFLLVAKMMNEGVKIEKSYSQFFHREINRHLNYRSLMTIVSVLNDSDMCDEGWVSRWGSPWIPVLELSRFLSGKESKIYPHIMKFDSTIDNPETIINDERCTKIS